MKFTSTIPTVSGWYWVYDTDLANRLKIGPRPAYITCAGNTTSVSSFGPEWDTSSCKESHYMKFAGPIESPEVPYETA